MRARFTWNIRPGSAGGVGRTRCRRPGGVGPEVPGRSRIRRVVVEADVRAAEGGVRAGVTCVRSGRSWAGGRRPQRGWILPVGVGSGGGGVGGRKSRRGGSVGVAVCTPCDQGRAVGVRGSRGEAPLVTRVRAAVVSPPEWSRRKKRPSCGEACRGGGRSGSRPRAGGGWSVRPGGGAVRGSWRREGATGARRCAGRRRRADECYRADPRRGSSPVGPGDGGGDGGAPVGVCASGGAPGTRGPRGRGRRGEEARPGPWSGGLRAELTGWRRARDETMPGEAGRRWAVGQRNRGETGRSGPTRPRGRARRGSEGGPRVRPARGPGGRGRWGRGDWVEPTAACHHGGVRRCRMHAGAFLSEEGRFT